MLNLPDTPLAFWQRRKARTGYVIAVAREDGKCLQIVDDKPRTKKDAVAAALRLKVIVLDPSEE
jgi:hypothetical protein